MKTGRDAGRSGLYVSECCLKEFYCLEGQMLPRCPRCYALTVWELEEFEKGSALDLGVPDANGVSIMQASSSQAYEF